MPRHVEAIRLRLASFCALALLGAIAQAQEFDYDPARPAALLTCDEPRDHGREPQARACYQNLLRTSADAGVRAEAAWSLGDFKQANDLFREAARAEPKSVRVRTRWGRLYLAAHQDADAIGLFREALELDPEDRQSKLATARLLAERFDSGARAIVTGELKEDDELIEAHLLAARMSLEEGHLDDAASSLERARSLAEKQDRAPLEAFSLLAALDLLRGDETPQRWVQRALAYNPRYGGVYETLAHYEILRRRYQQATVWLQRAVEVQPDLWSAHAELGANLMRLGAMDEGREHLVKAYSGDPYSATTVNTLRLLDSLDQFIVERSTAPDLITRLHRDEAAALRPYVLELARLAIETFSKRYGFTPAEPITVEIYPDHDDFAVRTAGLPGIGLLGVTFGYLLAMDSPSGRPKGEFHWGSTLWHEMAHVFTLSMTGHRVPRWLSEGVSVFEEWRTGPTPGVAVTPATIAAFGANNFLPVATLDEGFIRPKYPEQIQVSYMQSGLICLFIEQRFGFERLVALLREFQHDTTTAAAVRATFKMAPEEFDKQLNAFVRERFAKALARPHDFLNAMDNAQAAAEKEDWSTVVTAAHTAIDIFPEYTGTNSAHLLLANALNRLGRRPEAIAALRRYRELGGWDPSTFRELAKWLEEAGDTADAIRTLYAVNYSDPLDTALHGTLGDQMLAAGQNRRALTEFEVLMALDTHDKAAASFGMARALYALGDTTRGRRHLLETLEMAPHYKPAQALLLEKTGDREP